MREAMANNNTSVKSLGMDGLLYKFYLYMLDFFNKVLVDSYNKCFMIWIGTIYNDIY